MNISYSIIFAVSAGALPALLWLWFWLHEDRAHPEPRKLIALAFAGGMMAVFVSLVLEKIAYALIPMTTLVILVWAAIEELSKYALISWLILYRKENDEPIDSVVYMITGALGFAALENTLFLLNPILQSDFLTTMSTMNLRFVGSTLLHVVASSTIGIALAFAFNKSKSTRSHALWIGMIIAIALHTLFNLFILYSNSVGIIMVFSVVWLAIIILILLFEKIKRLQN